MLDSIKLLFRLCLFQGTPANLSWSPVFFWLLFLIHFMLLISGFQADEQVGIDNVFVPVLISYVLVGAAFYLILKFRKQSNRFFQGFTSYLGAEVFFMGTLALISELNHSMGQVPASLKLLTFGLGVWSFMVKANVVRLTMDTQMVIGVLVELNFQILRFLPFFIMLLPLLTTPVGVEP